MTTLSDAAPTSPRVSLTHAQERWVLAATIIASSMAFVDMSIVNVALPVLQHGLDASFAEAQWVVEAYTLFLSALILTGGAIGDLYGRRRMFSLGILIFALASAGWGPAPQTPGGVAARGASGPRAPLIAPGGLAILPARFSAQSNGP